MENGTIPPVRSMKIAWLLTVAALVALASPAPAVRASQQQPQFRTGTDIVPVDFLAYGANGLPVTDLTLKDVRLLVDGKARDIKSFQFIRLANTAVEGPVAAPVLPLPFGSNQGERPGRSVIVVVDHEQIRPDDSRPAIDAIKAFINQLTPIDRAAVVTLPNGKVEADLTTNHDRVRAALDRVVGRAARRTGIGNISLNEALVVLEEVNDPDKKFTNELVDRECRYAPTDSACRPRVVQEALQYAREVERNTRATLQALREFLQGLSGVEAPTAVLFLSGTLVDFPDTHIYLENVSRAAARGRVQMFVIQPNEPMFEATGRDSNPSATADNDRRIAGLRDLAGVTGGEFVRLAGTGVPVMARIANELSSHYLLGFEPRPAEQDGKPHKIQLETARKDITLRVRPTFILDDPKRAGPTPMVLETLLRETTTRRDVPLHAAAYVFRDADPRNVKVIVAMEPGDAATTLTSAAFALIDLEGKSAAQWTEEGANVVTRPLITAAAVPAGDYRLRVAATDTTGKRGTVDYEFRAGLAQGGPLTFSSLMAGWMDRATFRPQLVLPPATPAVVGYLEFYGSLPSGAVLSARFEVAETPDGAAVATAPGSVLGAAETTRFVATGGVPLAGLKPGDYALRAIILIDDKPVARVSRTIRKLP